MPAHPARARPPTLDRLRTDRDVLIQVDAGRRSADEAEAAAAAEQRRRTAAERKRRDDERRDSWVRDRRERQQAAWDTSELKRRVLARHGGTVPTLFTVALGSEGGVYAPREHWRAAVYRDLVRHKTGQSFTVRDVYRTMHKQGIKLADDARARSSAIIDWLEHLGRQGYVTVDRDRDAWGTIVRITVLGDLEHPRSTPPPARRPGLPSPRTGLPRSVPGTRPACEWAARATTPTPRPTAGTTPRSTALPRRASTLRCRRCRLPLDPVLADAGLHIGC